MIKFEILSVPPAKLFQILMRSFMLLVLDHTGLFNQRLTSNLIISLHFYFSNFKVGMQNIAQNLHSYFMNMAVVISFCCYKIL